MNGPAVEAIGLTKTYGASKVLIGMDLTVPAGGVFALLGPNGAGKTTLVRILATLTRADGGQARVAGYDIVRQRREVRRRISLTGQYASVDEIQTGAENLRMMARLAGLGRREARRRADELLDRFGLGPFGGQRVAGYSGGTRRRLDLAASLVVEPEVLFLDEPTTGLDLRSRQILWEAVADLARRGVTVFLTTQYLEEADRLADRVAVMAGGHLIADGTPQELKQRLDGGRLELVLADISGFEALASRLADRMISCDAAGLTVSVPTDGTAATVRALLDELDPDRTAVHRFTVHTPTLDDVFLSLTETAHV